MNVFKKTIIKITVFVLTFFVALIVGGKLMNKGHNNMTMEMAQPDLPVVTMRVNGVEYNRLFGYKAVSDTAFQRDTVTLLGENRDIGFAVDTYENDIAAISIEVRSMDGSRLIEDTPITGYREKDGRIVIDTTLKDLIEKDTEYSLAVVLDLDGEQEVRYYTRVIWSDNMHLAEKMDFVTSFHEKLYDKDAAKELTRYLETNAQLENNKSFYKVNIHSSFNQITWGDMQVREVGRPSVRLTDIASQTASFLLDYTVATREEKQVTYYRVKEHYRVRYTSDRMYLLDFERTMEQIPDENHMYANDKILLGITDENVVMSESEDGNTVVFQEAGKLLSYNATNNKLTVVFSFYDNENMDARAMNDAHAMKILDVDEAGNLKFAVYGYMNRGRHEGEVGIQVYTYDSAMNTLDEAVYIPYSKTFAVLKAEMEQLLYLNRDNTLYLFLENAVYGIDLTEKTCRNLVSITQDDSFRVSESNKMIVWQEGTDIYDCSRLMVRNLGSDSQYEIAVNENETIRPLGFMQEDIIYGVARKSDVIRENSGAVYFPMYKLSICDPDGNLLKEYQQEGIYIMDCVVEGNQITLQRAKRMENGLYDAVADDQITDNMEEEENKNQVVAADIDIYERYVQIQTKTLIDAKTVKILTPKEVVFEGGRELQPDMENGTERYYVYGAYGVDSFYTAPAKAVNAAYAIAGVVINNSGDCVWMKGNRVSRNQIMAIKEAEVTEEQNSLAVCLDTILSFEGLVRNSAYLIQQGSTALEILEDNLEDAQILDLTGCNLDSVLYYVNQDIPVLAILQNGDAVLITGFNEFNVVIMEPATGRLYKKGMNDSAQWFAENGNRFVTYIRKD